MQNRRKSKVSIRFLIFALAFINYAYFFHREPGWNINSRLALTYSIVEDGSFSIDRYHDREPFGTGDKAFYNGHYYSDKIIGTSLLGTLPYGMLRFIVQERAADNHPELARYITRTFSVSVLAALTLVMLYNILLLYSERHSIALLGTLLFGFGTMFYGFSTIFYPYAPATLFILMALYRILTLKPDMIRPGYYLLIGLSLGLALLFEYTFGIVVLGLYLYLAIHKKTKIPSLILCFAGTILGLMPFIIYSFLIFGTITLPYKYEVYPIFQEGMSRGIMGITGPRLAVLYYITIHPYRGIFFLSPFLLLSFVGSAFWLKRKRCIAETYLCLFIIGGYLLFNASYYMWWGGWVVAPRHLLPMLPFMILTLIPLLQSGRLWRYLLYISGTIGVVMHFLIASVNPQEPQGYPTQYLLYPKIMYNFLSPFIHRTLHSFYHGSMDPNLGIFAGLDSFLSLVPLVIITAILIYILFKKALMSDRLDGSALSNKSDQSDRSDSTGCFTNASYRIILLLIASLFVSGSIRAQTTHDMISSPTKTVAAAFFYWYDDETGEHLWRDTHAPICTHPSNQDQQGHYPGFSWKYVPWFAREIKDMMEAGIDIIAVQFWGDEANDSWSIPGYLNLMRTVAMLDREGFSVPRVAPYIDTTALVFEQFREHPELREEMNTGKEPRRWVLNLLTPEEHAALYRHIQKAGILTCGKEAPTSTLPMDIDRTPFGKFWARNDGFPMVFIYEAGRGFFFWDWNHALFNNLISWFQRDFKHTPRLYPDYEWSLKDQDDDKEAFNLNGGGYIRWRSAVYEPYVMNTSVQMPRKGLDCVQLGPGYDDRCIPGRTANGVPIRSRDFGYFYCYGWQYALRTGRPLVMVESWNEFHESTNICDCLEFGRTYLRLTREYSRKFHTNYAAYPYVWCEMKHTNDDGLTCINDEEGLYQVDGGVPRYRDQSFGKEESDYLLDFVPFTDGKTEPAWRIDQQCRRTNLPAHPFIYFDIDDRFVRENQKTIKETGLYVFVKYFDEGYDYFRIRYDAEPFKYTEPIKKENTLTWKWHVFNLAGAECANQQAREINHYSFVKQGCDFSIDSMSDGDEFIGRVIVSAENKCMIIEPQEPVYIGIPAKVGIALIGKRSQNSETILISPLQGEGHDEIRLSVDDLLNKDRVVEVRFRQPGRNQICVKTGDGKLIAISPEVLVQKFRITAPAFALDKNQVSFSIVALNDKGEPDTDYCGRVWLPAVRAGDKTPSPYIFSERNQGYQQFSISFDAYGYNTIYMQDMNDYNLEGRKTVIIPPPPCSVVMNSIPDERNLYVILAHDGWVKPVIKDKKSCYQLHADSKDSHYIYLNIDDKIYHNLPRYNDIYISVQYYDSGKDSFVLQYDSHDIYDGPQGFKIVPLQHVHKNNSRTWKWVTFRVEDALFNNNTHHGDFRIDSLDGDEWIRRVAVSSTPGVQDVMRFKVEHLKKDVEATHKVTVVDEEGDRIRGYIGTLCLLPQDNKEPPTYYQIHASDRSACKITMKSGLNYILYEVGNLNHWGALINN